MKTGGYMKYILSFCIPTYNNADAVWQLVTELLKTKHDGFQIVIADNASTDDTIERLSKIQDTRLKIWVNEVNIGAQQNWCKALEIGDGEYLYLVMARDKLRSNRVCQLIELLENLKAEHIQLAIDRVWEEKEVQCKVQKKEFIKKRPDAEKIKILERLEGIDRFVNVGEHQTGFIFGREAFREIVNPSKYFATSYIYPDNYIRRDILANYPQTAIIHAGCYLLSKTYTNRRKVRSNVENGKEKKVLYYDPQRKVQDFIRAIQMVEYSDKFCLSKCEYDKFFLAKWEELMIHVSTVWKASNENETIAKHYNREVRDISKTEMLRNILISYKTIIKYYGVKRMGIVRVSKMAGMMFGKMIAIVMKYE